MAVTDNLSEVIEKLVILHIRTWFLEDMAGIATTDTELADIKRKVDICFKQNSLDLSMKIGDSSLCL